MRSASRSLGLALALSAGTAACHEVPAPAVVDAPAPSAEATAVEPAAPSAEAAPSSRPFGLRWATQSRPYPRAVAIDEHRLAVVSHRQLAVYDAATGKPLGARDVCLAAPGGLHLGETGLDVVCEREVAHYALPSLDYQSQAPLLAEDQPGRAEQVAVSRHRAAVAFSGGRLVVYDLPEWREAKVLAVDEPVSALALSPAAAPGDNWSLAVGLDGGDVILASATGSLQRHTIKRALPVEALAFASDGARLLSAAGPRVSVSSLEPWAEQRTYVGVGGVTAAAWLADGAISSLGRDGLLLLQGDGEIRSLGGGVAGAALGGRLASNGRSVAVVGPDGRLSHYGAGAASRVIPVPTPGGPGDDTTTARVLHQDDDHLVVEPHTAGETPDLGTPVYVYRYHEAKVGPVTSGRWIDTTEGVVKKLTTTTVEIEVGPLRNVQGFESPLAKGTVVKLVWQRPDADAFFSTEEDGALARN